MRLLSYPLQVKQMVPILSTTGLNCFVNKNYKLRNNPQMNIFPMLLNDVTFSYIIIDNIRPRAQSYQHKF